MILIIAEKPSVMKNIIDANLEGVKPKMYKGYAYGKDFIYTHCIGHLLTLMYPGEIDSRYIKWDLYNLPFRFEQIPLKVSTSVADQYKIVENLLLKGEITEVVNACDSDREGDLIFRNLFFYSKCKCKNVSRMWIESQTPEGIKESFDTRLLEKEYNNVYFAGKSRSYADYIIGLNSTRAMTCKFGSKDSVYTIGRVQTPTLRIIVDTEREITNFIPKKFYKLQAIGNVNGQNIVGNYINDNLDNNRFDTLEEANNIKDKVGIGPAIVKNAETTKKNEKPKMLYSLSDLQVDMDKRYGMSPIDVLNTVQALYETHKLVTYPRTDEVHISKKLASEAINILKGLCVNSAIRDEIINNGYEINPIMIAKKDIGAHEALTPTNVVVSKDQIRALKDSELKVYMAIVERFMAAFMPDAIIEKQKIEFVRNDEVFNAEFEACTFLGHRKAYVYNHKEQNNNKEFLSVKKDDIVNITEIKITDGQTTPPQRFTEGSLVKMMKNPTKYVTDKSDKAVLKMVEGIGTEATRASIIEELKKHELIEVDKKKTIKPTEKGMNLIDLIPSEKIKSVSLTAEFERKLDLISKGQYDYKEFLNEINALELDFINEIKGVSLKDLYNKQNSICNCPICNNYVVEQEKGYFCANRGCKVGILKNARGAKLITKEQAKNMLICGNSKTKVLCFSTKVNKDFESVMTYKYVAEDQYPNHIDLDFTLEGESEKETMSLKKVEKPICKCPICKSGIYENGNFYSCENKDCKVAIYKNARGVVKFTKKGISELLTDGITSTRFKVILKDNREIEVYLKYTYVAEDQYPNHIDYIYDKPKENDKNE